MARGQGSASLFSQLRADLLGACGYTAVGLHGTALRNPDFAAYARSFGGLGELVEKTEQFAPAFERAVASGLPAILELRLSEEVITPHTTLSAIRERATGCSPRPRSRTATRS